MTLGDDFVTFCSGTLMLVMGQTGYSYQTNKKEF
jgi:hypothetical protein